MGTQDLIHVNKSGIYCPAGNFYIDPWRPVENAVITHAHSDHARIGHKFYHCSEESERLLRHRLGEVQVLSHPYSKEFILGDVKVSLHSAGHILGSSQVRLEVGNRVWVVSGDYKRTFDPSCTPFEVLECETFISEATFAFPLYHWKSGAETAKEIFNWWQSDLSRPSILFCYSLGKAQRILAELVQFTDQSVFLHGAITALTELYRQQGIKMLPTLAVSEQVKDFGFKGELILAPPSAHRSAWMRRFKEPQTAFASGWMQIRGARRRKGYEKGFVLSDHADWNELLATIFATGAKNVYLTHGRTEVLERYLKEKGLSVNNLETQFAQEGATEEVPE